MRTTKILIIALVAVGMVAAVANPAAAWSGKVHEGAADAAADAGNLDSSYYQDKLADDAMWGDEVGTGCCEGDTFGVNKEYNAWYQGTAEFLLDAAGSDLPANADHWLAINAYDAQLGDSWDVAQYEPIGTAHYNLAEFAQNGREASYTWTSFDRAGKATHYAQDITVPYHTAAIDNIGYGTYEGKDGFNHLHYEGWASAVHEQYNFDGELRGGAESSWSVQLTSKDDVEEMGADVARQANSYANYIDQTGEWEDNVWATKELMNLQGKYVAIVLDYGTDDTYYDLEYDNGNIDTTEDSWWSL